MPVIAVLTTDVVGSTNLSSDDFDQLMKVLQVDYRICRKRRYCTIMSCIGATAHSW